MAGIHDFVALATQKLGVSTDAASGATAGVALVIQQTAGATDFGRLAVTVPGLSDLAKAAGAGGPGGLGGGAGGLASKGGGMLGGAGRAAAAGVAGAVAAVMGAGITGDKANAFLQMFVGYLKSKVPGDVLRSVLAKVPGLAALLG